MLKFTASFLLIFTNLFAFDLGQKRFRLDSSEIKPLSQMTLTELKYLSNQRINRLAMNRNELLALSKKHGINMQSVLLAWTVRNSDFFKMLNLKDFGLAGPIKNHSTIQVPQGEISVDQNFMTIVIGNAPYRYHIDSLDPLVGLVSSRESKILESFNQHQRETMNEEIDAFEEDSSIFNFKKLKISPDGKYLFGLVGINNGQTHRNYTVAFDVDQIQPVAADNNDLVFDLKSLQVNNLDISSEGRTFSCQLANNCLILGSVRWNFNSCMFYGQDILITGRKKVWLKLINPLTNQENLNLVGILGQDEITGYDANRLGRNQNGSCNIACLYNYKFDSNIYELISISSDSKLAKTFIVLNNKLTNKKSITKITEPIGDDLDYQAVLLNDFFGNSELENNIEKIKISADGNKLTALFKDGNLHKIINKDLNSGKNEHLSLGHIKLNNFFLNRYGDEILVHFNDSANKSQLALFEINSLD